MHRTGGPGGPLDQEWGCDESRVDAHPAPQDIVTKRARRGRCGDDIRAGAGPEKDKDSVVDVEEGPALYAPYPAAMNPR